MSLEKMALGLAASLLLAAACTSKLHDANSMNGTGSTTPPTNPGQEDPPQEQDDPPSEDPRTEEPPPPSEPYLRFKGPDRLAADFAQALDLPPDELCQELEGFDCFQGVHRIVLQGVEPYVLRVDEPVSELTAPASLAVERGAWAACERAVRRDFAGTGGVFEAVATRGDEGRGDTAQRLIERFYGRRATEAERSALVAFGPQLSPESWATDACFVVSTAVETLFY